MMSLGLPEKQKEIINKIETICKDENENIFLVATTSDNIFFVSTANNDSYDDLQLIVVYVPHKLHGSKDLYINSVMIDISFDEKIIDYPKIYESVAMKVNKLLGFKLECWKDD